MSASNLNSSPPPPMTMGPQTTSDILEMRAVEQRRRLHNTVVELRETVRDRINVRKAAREYIRPAIGAAAVCGLILGYGAGGIFVR